MAPSACLLLSFVTCMHFVHGVPPWLNLMKGNRSSSPTVDTPQTIDEVLMKASGGINSASRGRLGEDKFTDGLDMMLTGRQHDILFGQSRGRSMPTIPNPAVVPWTGGVIPYEIAYGHFDKPRMNKIKQAMQIWEELTCLTFRPAGYYDNHKVQIMNTQGCHSALGMIAGPQPLSLQAGGCFWRGTVEHEFGHAIGLVHEHQRPERDHFLGVNMQYVQPFFQNQLAKYAFGAVDKLGLSYDYYSVMHYGEHAFAYDGKAQTLYAYDPRTNQRRPDITHNLGKLQGPSFTDVKLVNLMYNCSARCQPMPSCRQDCFVDKHCQCICEDNLPPLPCADMSDDCEAVKARGDCYHPAISGGVDFFCKKTCGWCNEGNSRLPREKPDLPEEPCKDRRPDCRDWARNGDCQANPAYMLKFCRKSCHVCVDPNEPATTIPPQTTTPEGPCVDEASESECRDWANGGQCKSNPGYMLKHCKKSCKVCTGPEPDNTGPCVDEASESECRDWASGGQCESNPGYMLKHCKKSCKVCTGPEPDNTGPCVDDDAECAAWARNGDCSSPGYVLTHCKKSCKVCTGPEPDHTDQPCEDQNNECRNWARGDGCQQNPEYMLKFCRKSCRVCVDPNEPDTTRPPRTTTPEGPCRDDEHSCVAWARNGDCDKNPRYMAQNCRQACGLCGGGSGRPDTTGPCKDDNPACTAWAQDDQCNVNPGYMLESCKKACGVCGGGSDNSGACMDNDQGCLGWARYGQCHENPGYMMENCKKSCGVC